jgi:hypothetical protein
VRTIPIRDGRALVVLTERGRDVLERNGTSASSTSAPAFSAHASAKASSDREGLAAADDDAAGEP